MNIIICYILIYLVEAYILFNYCSKIFYSKHRSSIEIATICIGYSLLFAISFVTSFWLNMLSFWTINLIIILVLYDMKWYSAVLHASIVTAVVSSTELVSLSFITHFSPDFYSNIGYFRNLSILALISKLSYFLIMFIISHIVKSRRKHNAHIDCGTAILVIVPVITLFISASLFSLCLHTKLSLIQDYMISISAFLVLIINFMIFFYYDYSQKMSAKYTDMQLQLLEESAQAEYYKLLKTNDDNQKLLIHDIKNHLINLANLSSENDNKKISNYISNLLGSQALKQTPKVSDNPLLNVIIAHFNQLFEASLAKLYVDIRCDTINFLSEQEITSLFSNLLSNAFESCNSIKDGYTELSVFQKEFSNNVVICMINSCNEPPKMSPSGNLISTKKDSFKHGIGMKSIKKVINAHNGDIRTYYENPTKLFHTTIIMNRFK